MEIPYTVKPRPDTGLWNAKIGIWLFLASEVMLFGGLFSGYVFLRLGSAADPHYHWPAHVLEVLPGMINTFVLIASSVFVVLAWVQLKLKNWRGFQIWMTLVIACALAFMGIKAYEYNGKFNHYGITLKDNSYVAGHHIDNSQDMSEISKVDVDLIKGGGGRILKYVPDEEKAGLTFSYSVELAGLLPESAPVPTVADAGLNEKIEDSRAVQIALENTNGILAEVRKKVEAGGGLTLGGGDVSRVKKSVDKSLREAHEARMKLNREANKLVREHNAALAAAKRKAAGGETEEARKIMDSKYVPLLPVYGWNRSIGLGKIELIPEKPFTLSVPHNRLREAGDDALTFPDFTVVHGIRDEESRYLHIGALDLLDLRSLAEPGESAVFKYIAEHAGGHDEGGKHAAARTESGGAPAEGGGEAGHPTSAEIREEFFRNRDAVVAKAAEDGFEPDLKKKLAIKLDHVPARIPYEEIQRYSNYAPKQNTYYAIYFLLTGLHGLHVVAGALVLTYFLFSRKHFQRDPEHLANRVEVGGLFWHFVDLVWIFLFPVLYLM